MIFLIHNTNIYKFETPNDASKGSSSKVEPNKSYISLSLWSKVKSIVVVSLFSG